MNERGYCKHGLVQKISRVKQIIYMINHNLRSEGVVNYTFLCERCGSVCSVRRITFALLFATRTFCGVLPWLCASVIANEFRWFTGLILTALIVPIAYIVECILLVTIPWKVQEDDSGKYTERILSNERDVNRLLNLRAWLGAVFFSIWIIKTYFI